MLDELRSMQNALIPSNPVAGILLNIKRIFLYRKMNQVSYTLFVEQPESMMMADFMTFPCI